MNGFARPVVANVLQQHVDDAVSLHGVRSVLLRAPHVELHRLRRLDDRLAAHLDGIATAGTEGLALLEAQLATPTPGVVFALTVLALQGRMAPLLQKLVALAAALPALERGLLSALGWVSAEDLQGTVRALLGSKVALHRAWALAACAMHRVDPGPVLMQAVQDADAGVRARAWRVAAQLGRLDLADAARQALTQHGSAAVDEQATVLVSSEGRPARVQDERAAAAWALTLWGQGSNALVQQALLAPAGDVPWASDEALRLATMAAPLAWGRDQARALAAQAETQALAKRRMLRLAGWIGDPHVLPWLIQHMADPRWARLAGESFTLITGLNLDQEGMAAVPPEGLETGPDDDPAATDIALDEDDSLPWPDAAKVGAWWQRHGGRFTAGERCFMGAAPTASHVWQVLTKGAQRQRAMAAAYLCLLQPAGGLFPIAAPAWRQQRWLARAGQVTPGKVAA